MIFVKTGSMEGKSFSDIPLLPGLLLKHDTYFVADLYLLSWLHGLLCIGSLTVMSGCAPSDMMMYFV